LDRALIRRLAREHGALVTVEAGSVGGFGSRVLEALAEDGLLDRGVRVRTLCLPDAFLDHDTPAAQYARAGLDGPAIVRKALEALGRGARLERPRIVTR
jgi:1-deoxy-D-xylulose-5-phosphate synthase